MERKYYAPRPNDLYAAWLRNLARKILNYKIKYGLTDDEVKFVLQYSLDFDYRLDASVQVERYSQQWTAYRNALRYGVPEGSQLQAPVAPTLSPVTPVVDPGAVAHVSNIVTRIKNNVAYSIADGQDLGIEGTEIIIDPNKLQPELKPFLGTGGRPGLAWKKGHADGLVIYKDEGNGYRKYDTDIHPDYEDKAPFPAEPSVWKYKCIYLYHGEETGQWSNELTFNVGG